MIFNGLEFFLEDFIREGGKTLTHVPRAVVLQVLKRKLYNPFSQLLIPSKLADQVTDDLLHHLIVFYLQSVVAKNSCFTRKRANHFLKECIDGADRKLVVVMENFCLHFARMALESKWI